MNKSVRRLRDRAVGGEALKWLMLGSHVAQYQGVWAYMACVRALGRRLQAVNHRNPASVRVYRTLACGRGALICIMFEFIGGWLGKRCS